MAGSGGIVRLRQQLGEIWLLIQATTAATTAWLIAGSLSGHPDPFFAPIAAVVALGFARGERGASAVRLLLGVGLGIVVGEVVVVLLRTSTLSLALGIFVALIATWAFSANLLIRNQAAASAILTVIVAGGEAGFHRLTDALIGAGVALVFSRILFTPEPVALIRHAETTALTTMSNSLRQAATALERRDTQLVDDATGRLLDMRDELAEVVRTRRAGMRVTRHALLWRFRAEPVAWVNKHASRLDLIGADCLLVIRAAALTLQRDRDVLVEKMHDIAQALADLATDLADRQVRQQAADGALKVARELLAIPPTGSMPLAAGLTGLRMLSFDIAVYAGVGAADALTAVRLGTVPPPVSSPAENLRISLRPWAAEPGKGGRRGGARGDRDKGATGDRDRASGERDKDDRSDGSGGSGDSSA